MPKYNSTSPRPLPPYERLHYCLDYAVETGQLTWKLGHRKGKPAGCSTKYHRITIDGVIYMSHRVIWKWMTGEDPASDIDHRDRNKLNNRWTNLRMANRVEAVWNRHLPRSINPHRGVFPARGKWRARIRVDGIQQHLGTFLTAEEASAAYEAAARNLHGLFYAN